MRLLDNIPHLLRTFRLVWKAAKGWTSAWIFLLLIQGLLPVAAVYLTRLLVNALSAALGRGVSFANFEPILVYGLLMGGVLILTVPYEDSDAETNEHFPSLYNYQIRQTDQGPILENMTREGKREIFTSLTFHEGGGEVLEMRQFTSKSVVTELASAGFEGIKIYHHPDLSHGIWWPNRDNLPITARAV